MGTGFCQRREDTTECISTGDRGNGYNTTKYCKVQLRLIYIWRNVGERQSSGCGWLIADRVMSEKGVRDGDGSGEAYRKGMPAALALAARHAKQKSSTLSMSFCISVS
jgi:hypothetical protein